MVTRVPEKTAAELGLTEEELAEQVRLATEVTLELLQDELQALQAVIVSGNGTPADAKRVRQLRGALHRATSPVENPLPIECRARYQELRLRAGELRATFRNGNRNDVMRALLAMEHKAALAVLARMMCYSTGAERNSMTRYFMEVA